jgi:ABC-2 type transport system permease protein
LKAYLSVIRLRFAVQLQYRAAAAAAFFTQVVFGFIRVMVFHAFYSFSTVAQPMTLEQAVSYTWLLQSTFRMQPYNGDREVIDLIRSGNVAYELCRPVDMYFIWYSRLLSLRVVPTLLSGVPMFILATILPENFGLTLPVSVAAGVAWMLSMFLALLLGCAVSNLITISTLWTIAGDGMQRIFPAFIMILSGAIIPLAYFPDGMQVFLKVLPFSGLVDTPFRFYLGMIPASELFSFVLLQLAWTAFFIFIGILLMKVAIKRVVIQGG